MKPASFLLFAAALLAGAPTVARAQAADTAAIARQQAAMRKLDWMDGRWRGPATSRGPGGEHPLVQTERIGGFLDGTLKLVEGRGYLPDGSTGFHALGVISFDPATGDYWMTSNAQGRSGRFRLAVTESGWSWEVPAGGAVIRYTATRTADGWTEVGDYVAPSQPARRVFEMRLQRIGDTDWPEAGAVPMK
jgi:hypothetical protein